jgi:hypothetical protein
VEGAGMWRWAFLPPDRQKEEEIYGSLWQSLVRWLVTQVGLLPSQRLSLRTDAITFRTDEAVRATLLARDWSGKPPQVELRGGQLKEPQPFPCVPHSSYPGQYNIGLGRLPEGRYTLNVLGTKEADSSATTVFDVRESTTERLDVRARPATMRLVAKESGGAVLETVEPRLLAKEFHQYLVRTRPQRTARTLAWDRWWMLTAALVLWGTAWGLRRRSGLV